jgi:nucleoside-diphosphate-sugar epimerase
MMRLKGRHILVTGGAGFLGSHLCEKLLIEGAGVRVLDLLSSGRENHPAYFLKHIEFSNENIACTDSVLRAAAGVDAIVHLAFPMALRQRSIETKVITEILSGLLNLVQAALASGTLLIYISSIAVYGDGGRTRISENHRLKPVLLHGAVKLAGENICQTLAISEGLRVVTLRLADIYGPRNARVSVPIKFLLQAMRGEPVTIFGDGSDTRTYTFVDDFSEAVVLSLSQPKAVGGVFNIGGDECVSMSQLANEVIKITGSGTVHLQNCPAAGRRLFIDNGRAKKVLGFKPRVKLDEGLAITHLWLQSNPGFYAG